MNRLKVEAYRLMGQTPDVFHHRGAQWRALVTGQQVGQGRDIILQQTGKLACGSHSPSIDSDSGAVSPFQKWSLCNSCKQKPITASSH